MGEEEEDVPDLIEIPTDTEKIIPITVLSGFLGSGKTTLLNYILTKEHGKRIAVIENEFSAGLGIEGMIAKSGINGENISNFFELNNGCICCTVKDDLIKTLEQLILHKDKFDYILIETTGMANPGPLITSFWTDQQLGSYLRLDGVICVVDSANILQYLSSSEIAFEVKQQVCYADRILLNKVDLISQEQIIVVEETIRLINPVALIEKTSFTQINLDFVLSTNSYSPSSNPSEILPSSDTFGTSGNVFCFPCIDQTQLVQEVAHPVSAITSLGFQYDQPFDYTLLRKTLDEILYNNGANEMKIYRMKGFVRTFQSKVFYILQAVYTLFELEESSYPILESGNKKSRIIIIGYNLDSLLLEKKLALCLSSP